MKSEQRDWLRRRAVECDDMILVTSADVISLLDAFDAIEQERDRYKREIEAAGEDDFDWSVLERLDELDKVKGQLAQSRIERDRAIQNEQSLRAEISAAFHKHGLAPGPAAVDGLVRQRDDAVSIIHDLRRKLAEAGVEGSPPPGRETIIGTLKRRLREVEQERDCCKQQMESSLLREEESLAELSVVERDRDAARAELEKIRLALPIGNRTEDHNGAYRVVGRWTGSELQFTVTEPDGDKLSFNGDSILDQLLVSQVMRQVHSELMDEYVDARADCERFRKVLDVVQLRNGYILGMCRGEEEMKAEAKEVVRVIDEVLEERDV